MSVPIIAIHGGAGTMGRHQMSPEQHEAHVKALQGILLAARQLLVSGETAMTVVVAAVKMLEDCPLFNAGVGAVFTEDEGHELDAAVMDGSTLAAGAVAGVSRIRNPVEAARLVMEEGRHVLMIGSGAERMAEAAGLSMVSPDHFSTPHRLAQLHDAKRHQRGMLLDHDGEALSRDPRLRDRMGTVGAVAMDAAGHLAAATSTGGMTNKRPGRVGDSPLIGAGTYADDCSAAVSCTGHGEAFIRISAAHDVCARMRYGGSGLREAADQVVHERLARIGGSGGLIAVDRHGQVVLPFNTEGMYRGWVRADDRPHVFIYRDEEGPV